MTRDQLRAALVADENLKLKPYRDSQGVLTIGVGRNLDAVGISRSEAFYLLDNDIDAAVRDCAARLEWFAALDPVRQGVLVQMAFNLGIGGVLGFPVTLAAVKRGDYVAAAAGMLASKWASQTGRRAARLAAQMETGQL